MGAMTTRGRVLVVAVFLLAAALCATAAIALVNASDDSDAPVRTLPTVNPTLVFPSEQPTAAPSASATASSSPSPSPQAATPTPTSAASASPTSSPRPRVTTSPKPSPTKTVQAAGLYTNGTVVQSTGRHPGEDIDVTAHATDGDGSISLLSLDCGDGSPLVKGGSGTACSPPAVAPKDCADFDWTHQYAAAGSYTITIWIQSGDEKAKLQLPVTISAS